MKHRSQPANDRLLYLIFGLAALLSLFQLFFNRSLWLDESALALNIMERDYLALLQPLERNQVAPILFLWIEKFFSSLFGYHEIGFRLFPLLCYWGALYFFYRLLRHLHPGDRKIPLAALAMFAVSLQLIGYSSELKQYMCDVMITTLLIFLSVSRPLARNFKWLLLAGVLAIFLSNVAVIILATCGLFLLLYGKQQRDHSYPRQFLLFGLWGISFLAYYLLFIAGHPTQDMMLDYWQNAFMPLNPFSGEFWAFQRYAVELIFGKLLSFYLLWPVFAALYLFSILLLIWQKRFKILLLTTIPLLIHFILSGLQLYPFETRLILYLSPLFYWLIAIGTVHLLQLIPFKLLHARIWVLAPALVLLIPLAIKFPVEREEIKASIDYIDEHQAGDKPVFVYRMSAFPLEYYQKVYGYDFSVQEYFSESYDIESAMPANQDQYWLLFSHIYPKDDGSKTKEDKVVEELSREWTVKEVYKAECSSAYLLVRRG